MKKAYFLLLGLALAGTVIASSVLAGGPPAEQNLASFNASPVCTGAIQVNWQHNIPMGDYGGGYVEVLHNGEHHSSADFTNYQQTSHTFTGLEPGTTYDFYGWFLNETTWTAYTGTTSATTLGTPPPPPADPNLPAFNAQALGPVGEDPNNQAVQVDYQHGISGEDFANCTLDALLGGSSVATYVSTDPNQVTHTFTGLSHTTQYTMKGSCLNGTTQERYTSTQVVTTPPGSSTEPDEGSGDDDITAASRYHVVTSGGNYRTFNNRMEYINYLNSGQQQSAPEKTFAPSHGGYRYNYSAPATTNGPLNVVVGSNENQQRCRIRKPGGSWSQWYDLQQPTSFSLNFYNNDTTAGARQVEVECGSNLINSYIQTISYNYNPALSAPQNVWWNGNSFGSNGLFSNDIYVPASQTNSVEYFYYQADNGYYKYTKNDPPAQQNMAQANLSNLSDPYNPNGKISYSKQDFIGNLDTNNGNWYLSNKQGSGSGQPEGVSSPEHGGSLFVQ